MRGALATVALVMAVELPAQEPPALTAFTARRLAMVEVIAARGVADSATLGALRAVPRHEFVPAERRRDAYGDFPLPIGFGQTISQPYIVGYMTAVLRPRPGMRVLEVGTGSGYQAAVLAAIGCEVFTIEIVVTTDRRGFAAYRTAAGAGFKTVPAKRLM